MPSETDVPSRRTPVVALVLVALVAAGPLTGCLFPPVEPPRDGDPDDPDDPDDPGPVPGTVSRSDSWEQVGTIETAASVEGTPAGQEVHDFPLPPRIRELTLRFDWEPIADEDLDIRLALRDDGQEVWRHAAMGGRTGAPDRPVSATFGDLPVLYSENDTLLVATVTAKVTYETAYSVYIGATFDVPAT